MKTIVFDIMKGERYYTTFAYRYTPTLSNELDMNEVIEYAQEHYPSIRNTNYKLCQVI